MINYKHKDHNHIYAIATLLDVRLIKGDLLIATKQEIVKILKDANDGTSDPESDASPNVSLNTEEPPEKHIRVDPMFYKLFMLDDEEVVELDKSTGQGSITVKLTMAVDMCMASNVM